MRSQLLFETIQWQTVVVQAGNKLLHTVDPQRVKVPTCQFYTLHNSLTQILCTDMLLLHMTLCVPIASVANAKCNWLMRLSYGNMLSTLDCNTRSNNHAPSMNPWMIPKLHMSQPWYYSCQVVRVNNNKAKICPVQIITKFTRKTLSSESRAWWFVTHKREILNLRSTRVHMLVMCKSHKCDNSTVFCSFCCYGSTKKITITYGTTSESSGSTRSCLVWTKTSCTCQHCINCHLQCY